MTALADCGGCSSGNHDMHDATVGTRPWLIGGTVCPCKGDCAERKAAADIRLTEFFQSLRSSSVGEVQQ